MCTIISHSNHSKRYFLEVVGHMKWAVTLAQLYRDKWTQVGPMNFPHGTAPPHYRGQVLSFLFPEVLCLFGCHKWLVSLA